MPQTIERVTKETPKEIIEIFSFPYKHFSFLGKKTRTVLDAGCGQATNYDLLKQKFGKVILIDKEKTREEVIQSSLLKLPLENKSVDVTFCFEVIEHFSEIEQEIILKELFRVTKDYVIVGSVNKNGPDFYKGVEIFKAKNNKNPFHVHELDMKDFIILNNSIDPDDTIVDFYHSEPRGDILSLEPGLSEAGLVNYAYHIL